MSVKEKDEARAKADSDKKGKPKAGDRGEDKATALEGKPKGNKDQAPKDKAKAKDDKGKKEAPKPVEAKKDEPEPAPVEAKPEAPKKDKPAPVVEKVEPEPVETKREPPPARDSAAGEEPELAHLIPADQVTFSDPNAPAPAPGVAPPGDSRSMRRWNGNTEEFVLIYRDKSFLIRRQGVVGKEGEWTCTEYPSQGSAANAYAHACSELTGSGFYDLR